MEGIGAAHEKTFDWIFDDVEETASNSFSAWLQGTREEGLYWIYGKAGSGKSTLMKYICKDPRTQEKLQQWAKDDPLTIVSFFFWISGTKDQCSQTGLLRALLLHLLERNRSLIRATFPDLWHSLDINLSSRLRDWSLQYVTEAIRSLLHCDLGKVAIFIDGLDEYHGDHPDHLSPSQARPEHYQEIVTLIKSLRSANVKVCFSSRPLQIFHNHFDKLPKIDIKLYTRYDIYRFVKDKLHDSSLVQEMVSERGWDVARLVNDIVVQSAGVFQWVALVVKSLMDGLENADDVYELEARLEACPTDLMELYNHMFSNISQVYFQQGCEIFAMIDAGLKLEQKVNDGEYGFPYAEEILTLVNIWYGLEYSNTAWRHRPPHPLGESLGFIVRDSQKLLVTRCAGFLETVNESYVDELGRWTKLAYVVDHTSGNLAVKYIHRTAKEFLDMPRIRSIVTNSTASGFDAEIALLAATVRRIRSHGSKKDIQLFPQEETDFLKIIDTACLAARSLEDTGNTSHYYLVDQLDMELQSIYWKTGSYCTSWSRKTMFEYFDHVYQLSFTQNRGTGLLGDVPKDDQDPGRDYTTFAPAQTTEWRTIYSRFYDDFIALTVVYSLSNYVQYKITQDPELVKNKQGRPYLDYALAICCWRYEFLVSSRMVRTLLNAGASPNDHCPPMYGMNTWLSGFISEARCSCETWTPWLSALNSIMTVAVDATHFDMRPPRSFQNRHRREWGEVMHALLDAGADVSVAIMVVPYTSETAREYDVIQIVEYVFRDRLPVQAEQLIEKIMRNAKTQGHTSISTRAHEMSEVHSTYDI